MINKKHFMSYLALVDHSQKQRERESERASGNEIEKMIENKRRERYTFFYL